MKSVLVLVFLVVAVSALEEQDSSEDFQNGLEHKVRNRRWLFQDKCKAHSDCGANKCCYRSMFGNSCTRKRGLHEFCSTNPSCGCSCTCQVGLECRRIQYWPRYQSCRRPVVTPPPTEEPGSGNFE